MKRLSGRLREGRDYIKGLWASAVGRCGAGDWDEETQREGSKDRKFHMELVYAEGYFKSSVYLTAERGEDVSLPRPNNSQRSGSEHCALWAHYTIALENRMLIHTPEGLFSQALGLDLHVNHMAAAIWHTAIPDDENLWAMEVVQLVKCFPWEHGDLRSALQHPWK